MTRTVPSVIERVAGWFGNALSTVGAGIWAESRVLSLSRFAALWLNEPTLLSKQDDSASSLRVRLSVKYIYYFVALFQRNRRQ